MLPRSLTLLDGVPAPAGSLLFPARPRIPPHGTFSIADPAARHALFRNPLSHRAWTVIINSIWIASRKRVAWVYFQYNAPRNFPSMGLFRRAGLCSKRTNVPTGGWIPVPYNPAVGLSCSMSRYHYCLHASLCVARKTASNSFAWVVSWPSRSSSAMISRCLAM